ncbi:MAG: hypothetical protein R2879_19495 [Saprospiraceae bacterium]
MENILNYFSGEKLQCTLGLVISILFILTSVYFLNTQKSLLNGMAYSILPLAILLSVVCIGVVIRTPNDIKRVTAFYQEAPDKLKSEELPRMEKVLKSFSLIKKIEIGIFILGLILMIIFWKNELVKGIAMGLLIQGVVLYLFDHFAESRAFDYIEFLKSKIL